MQRVMDVVTGQPLWVYGAVAGGLLLILALIVGSLVTRASFARRIRSFLRIPGTRSRRDFFRDDELLRRTRQIERIADKHGADLIGELEMDKLWTRRLADHERRPDFERVLRYAPERGLFTCFLIALRNPRLARILESYMAENNDFLVLRKLALSGRGEPFSGQAARA